MPDCEMCEKLAEALRLTQEYISSDALPPIEGWSWYDALTEYRDEPFIPADRRERPLRAGESSSGVPQARCGVCEQPIYRTPGGTWLHDTSANLRSPAHPAVVHESSEVTSSQEEAT